MKNVSNETIASIILFIIITIILWLFGSFVAWNFNPALWSSILRTLIAIILLFALIVIVRL